MHGYNAGPENWINDASIKTDECQYENCLIYQEDLVEKALPYELARQGFDVWLGTWRGTDNGIYSKNNSLNEVSDRKQFWDFNYDTMADYDFPAMINYILDKTPAYKLSVVGHNEGTNTVIKAMSRNFFATKVDSVLGIQPCFVRKMDFWVTDDSFRQSYVSAMEPFYKKETSVIANLEWESLQQSVCNAPRFDDNSIACTYINNIGFKQPISVESFD